MSALSRKSARKLSMAAVGPSVLLLASGLGCAGFDPALDTCESIGGGMETACVAGAGAGAGGTSGQDEPMGPADWSCVGREPPPAPVDIPEIVTYTFPLVEWVSNRPLPGRTVRVCNRIEATCANPITTVNVPDTDRNAVVEIPGNLDVFLLLDATSGNPMNPIIPTVLYFDGALYSDQTGGRIQMLTAATTVGLATQLGINLNFEQGVLSMRAHDCAGRIVGGAFFSIDDTSGMPIPYTFVNGLPRAAVPPMPAPRTIIMSDNSPWAGFVNVPPRPLTVHGFMSDGEREFGSIDVTVKEGMMNAIEIRPLNRL